MDWNTWDKQYGEAQIEKWRDGIDLRTATDSEIQEYTSTKLYEYMECDRAGYGKSYGTWFYFYEDFSYFTAKDFDRLGQYYLEELRRQLRYSKKEMYRSWAEEDAEFERFMARFETLPRDTNSTIDAFKALPTEALPVDTNESAIPVDTDDPVETNAPDTLVDAPSAPEAPVLTVNAPKAPESTIDTPNAPKALESTVNDAPRALELTVDAPSVPVQVEFVEPDTHGALESTVNAPRALESTINAFEAVSVESDGFEAPVNTIEAIPVDINKRNQPAVPSANTTEPSVEDAFTSTIDYCFAGSSIPKSLLATTLISPQSIPLTSGYLAWYHVYVIDWIFRGGGQLVECG